MRTHRLMLIAGIAVATTVAPAAASAASAASAQGRFTTFDVPGATFTGPLDVNDAGVVVGVYVHGGASHGFIDRRGQFTTLDVPGA